MATVTLNWDVSSHPAHMADSPSAAITLAICGEAQEVIRKTMPDLQEAFPVHRPPQFQAHFDAGWFGLRLVFPLGAPMMAGPKMEAADISYLKSKIEPFVPRSPYS